MSHRPEPAPAAPPPAPPTLLYIVGHHKSGSTLMGAILGGSPEIFFAGELYRFPKPIWIPGDPARMCSCGRSVLECPLWSSVRDEYEPTHELAALRAGQRRFERASRFLATWRDSRRGRSDFVGHVAAMDDLVALLARKTGARVVVESGFAAVRGWVYRQSRPERLRVKYLHLVRDGRAFLWSEVRLTDVPEDGGWWVRTPPVIVARWVVMNLLAIALCGQDPSRYLRVRYEELVTAPRATLRRIGEFVGVDLGEVIEKLEGRISIPQRHIAAGSWHRMDGPVVLRPDFSWRTGLPRSTQALYWVTTGWLARLFGYRRRPVEEPSTAVP